MSNKDQISGAFLANISHEIRTPLNAIIGMTELLMESNLPAPQGDYLKVVQQSSEELLGLVNDILTLSKLQAKTLELEAMPFNLLELVDSVIDRFVKQADQKHIHLFCDVEPCHLPQLIGDPIYLRKVVGKLIDNALKFTEGGGEVIIKVEAIPESVSQSTQVRFQVCDTGIGVPQENLAMIFDNFAQVKDILTHPSGGIGIGLSITKRLVELLGSTVKVDSQVGKGSRFYFDVNFPFHLTGSAEINNLQPNLSGRKTLVIDESKTGRDILCKLLRGWGAVVTEVKDCSAADAMLQRHASDFSLAFVAWRDTSCDSAELARGWVKHFTRRGLQVVLVASRKIIDSNLADDTNNVQHLAHPLRPTRLINLLVNELGFSDLMQNRQPQHDELAVSSGSLQENLCAHTSGILP